MPKRIVQVCSGHPSDDARVMTRTSGYLAELGYEVHLIAADSAQAPYQHENRVWVHPVPYIESSLKRMARRGQVAKIAAALKPDLYHVHEPELLGSILTRKRGKPVIFDAHELYVEVLRDREWIPEAVRPLLSTAWDRWERMLVKRCAGLIVVTEGVADHYRNIHKKMVIVANFPDLTPHLSLPAPQRDGVTCIFSGSLNLNRGLLNILEAIAILDRRGAPAKCIIAGRGSAELTGKLESEANRLGIARHVKLLGPYEWHEGLKMASEASIGLVPHLAEGNNLVAWPVKMLDYMALGLPLVYSDLSCHQELLAGHEVGIPFRAGDPESLANAIETLVKDRSLQKRLGEQGRALTASKLNWVAEREKLRMLVEGLIGKP